MACPQCGSKSRIIEASATLTLRAGPDVVIEAPPAAAHAPAARRISSDDTVDALERVVERRGSPPAYIRCDNGPELTAVALKDWCRFTNVTTCYIEPGAPWQNPYIESFNGHLRNELLDLESFNSLLEAQIPLEDWRQEYNHYRPHQSLNYETRQHSPANGMLNTTTDSHNKWDQRTGSGHCSQLSLVNVPFERVVEVVELKGDTDGR